MVLFYVEVITERILYTLDFIFNDRAIQYRVTNDIQSFLAHQGIKCNYSNRSFSAEIFAIVPATVLFEDEVSIYTLNKEDFSTEECLSFNGIVDPLASIFYVLSRMEEYTNLRRDRHDRFEAKESILYQFGWLDRLMCERWSVSLIKALESHAEIVIQQQSIPFKIIPTFDIDNAFAFKWKPLSRRFLAHFRDVLKGNHLMRNLRKEVLMGKKKDPYDTYDKILEIARRGYSVKLFWLLGDYARFDKNIPSADLRQAKLIQNLSEHVEIHLHPSYKSNEEVYSVKKERNRLARILKNDVTQSRQHFLKLTFPLTYRNLIKLGFTDDYTMGYADEVGFRAGTLRSYRWFDLHSNTTTDFMIHPFAYMDGTLNEYKMWSIEISKQKIKGLIKEAQQFGGDFVCVWHNETIGGFGKWKGWEEVLEFTLFHKI